MNEAQISRFTHGARDLVNIAIGETGEYRIPSEILAKPVLATALDVVNLLVDRAGGCLKLQPVGNVVTTELLTEDVRIEIYPKVSFDALNLLLEWSTQPTDALPGCRLPVGFERETGFFDLFVRRFVSSLEDIIRNGWCPRIVSRELISEELGGQLDVSRSIEHCLTRLEVAFQQRRDQLDFNCPANRVLRTALVFLARSGKCFSNGNLDSVRELLSEMPACQVYSNTREAASVCELLLTTRGMDSGRDYYYAALTASVPILESISRLQGGSVEDEHIPIRIPMPLTFESALRNVTAAHLERHFVVSKGGNKRLYSSADPNAFNPILEPDIVITRLGHPLNAVAVFDVKYKEKPSASDHHQLAAYMFAYRARLGGFLTLAVSGKSGLVSTAATSDNEEIVEYAIDAGNLASSVLHYLNWLSNKLRVS